jgi:hypothetical protein
VDWSIRDVPPGTYKVGDVFGGLDTSHTLTSLYREEKDRVSVLRDTPLVVTRDDVYGYVDDEDGTIYFGLDHMKTSEPATVYLDILHELVHVKQLKDGRNLYDRRYAYVDRPTEIEAYALVVEEARRLGLNDAQIAEYLYVEWASPKDHERLCRRLGVDADRGR